MSEPSNQLPFDLPEDPAKYAETLRQRTAWLRSKFGSGVHATSAIHDVVVRVLERRAAGENIPVHGFWRAVIRKVFDQFRRNRRHEGFVAAHLATLEDRRSLPSAASVAEAAESARKVQAAINQVVESFSPGDRDLWGQLNEGVSYQQIADATDRSVAAVKQAAYRIRLRIQIGLPKE